MCQEIEGIKQYIIRTLKKYGFAVQLYQSHSSNSVYIKVDYGLCNTIRISDHRGKALLAYRFNLRKDVKSRYTDKSKPHVQYMYPFSDKRKVIDEILYIRKKKIAKNGVGWYIRELQTQKQDNSNKRGFWEKCQLVCDYDVLNIGT